MRFAKGRVLGSSFAALSLTLLSACSGQDDVSRNSHKGSSYQGSYYEEAEGKSGESLRYSLSKIVSRQETLSYQQVWDALKDTDEDPKNSRNVKLLYTGRSQHAESHGGSGDSWNREHVWPKSLGDFGTSKGAGTDLHHLRPTDATVNSTRGNKDFDEGGEEVPSAPGNFASKDSFEPRDEVKGDVARMIFYMSVRYKDEEGLEIVDEVDNGSKPRLGKLSTLMKWHKEDPPDKTEKKRNEKVFKIQKNRNPFIDQPQWAQSIW